MEKLKEEEFKTGVYLVAEKSWIDIEQWEEYKKTLNELLP